MKLETAYNILERRCKEILDDRGDSYGDSYKQLRFDSIIDLIAMKVQRLKNKGLKLGSKAQDEIIDIRNYCAMAYKLCLEDIVEEVKK